MLNQNTVKTIETVDGRIEYDVLDSLGRRLATFGGFRDAVTYAGERCRFGWPLDTPEHSSTGDCDADHEGYVAAVELSSLANV